MNRLVIPSLLAAGLLGLSACVAPQPRAGSAQMSAAAPAAASGTQRMSDRYCLRATGSRIVPRDQKADKVEDFDRRCLSSGGRVYTREDIDRTGEVDLADALRKLDPSIH